jgi:hypothetical protein
MQNNVFHKKIPLFDLSKVKWRLLNLKAKKPLQAYAHNGFEIKKEVPQAGLEPARALQLTGFSYQLRL